MDITPSDTCHFRSKGFSLIELVTSLAVSAALLTVGIPAYRKLISVNRLTSEINLFIRHIHIGRSAATKSDEEVILCPSADGQHCTRRPVWNIGYMVYADRNENRRHDPDEPVLRRHTPAHDDIAITSSIYRRRILFQRDGSTPGSNPTIVFCDLSGNAPPRAIIVSNTGRPRVSRTRANGKALVCR